jgi:hypothetical protein
VGDRSVGCPGWARAIVEAALRTSPPYIGFSSAWAWTSSRNAAVSISVMNAKIASAPPPASCDTSADRSV